MKALSDSDIHLTLIKIAKLTYPNSKIPSFSLKLVNKENKRYHGIYYFPNINKWGKFQKGKIEVHNLTRNPQFIICVAIHELAHHCDFTFRKTTDHSNFFYEVYARLLKTTIEQNYINYDIARQVSDVGDIYQLEKYFKYIIDIQPKENKDKRIIKVFNNFAQGKILKGKSYVYSKIEKCWTLELNSKEVEKEIKKLTTFFKEKDIKIFTTNDLNFEAKSTITIKIIKPEFQKLNLLLKESKSYKFNLKKNIGKKLF